MTAEEKRLRVRDKYREILGRNRYSQAKRDYCYKRASDGCYYNDRSTPRGNRKLIKVVWFIQGDSQDERPKNDSMLVVTVNDAQSAWDSD